MQKLDEYERRFRDAQGVEAQTDTLANIASEMVGEIGELRRQRKAQSAEALMAVVKDVVDRWERFCERINLSGHKHLLLRYLHTGTANGGFIYQQFIAKYPGKKLPGGTH